MAALRIGPRLALIALALLLAACEGLPAGVATAVALPPSSATPAPTATAVAPPATPSPGPAAASGRTPAQVVHVVDGDTITVEIDGQEFTVRYIGVDTPETVRPNYPVEWMGPEASAANKALVEGKTVYLEKDVSETDRYGRLLRYVYLADGTFVNAELVRQGYAQAITYPPDVKHQELLGQVEREARDAGRGLWGGTATPEATVPAATAPGAALVIVAVDKRAEYVDLQNVGGAAVSLDGWVLVSERGDQRCPLGGVVGPGATLRVWALAADAARGGLNCGLRENIWSNSEADPAVLYDAQGREVARK